MLSGVVKLILTMFIRSKRDIIKEKIKNMESVFRLKLRLNELLVCMPVQTSAW